MLVTSVIGETKFYLAHKAIIGFASLLISNGSHHPIGLAVLCVVILPVEMGPLWYWY